MADQLPDRSEPRNHRVVLQFDDGLNLKLICPETGCTPATVCGECHRHVDDEERGPCDECPDPADTCWVKGWFDNCTYDELLHGDATVEVECEWDGDQINVEIVGSDADRLRAENEALKAERDRFKSALEDIDRLVGKVCPEYEICEHIGCSSSYGAWSIANGALGCTEPLEDAAVETDEQEATG